MHECWLAPKLTCVTRHERTWKEQRERESWCLARKSIKLISLCTRCVQCCEPCNESSCYSEHTHSSSNSNCICNRIRELKCMRMFHMQTYVYLNQFTFTQSWAERAFEPHSVSNSQQDICACRKDLMLCMLHELTLIWQQQRLLLRLPLTMQSISVMWIDIYVV